MLANLDKPKQRYMKFLEGILFGFGLSKLGNRKFQETDRKFQETREQMNVTDKLLTEKFQETDGTQQESP